MLLRGKFVDTQGDAYSTIEPLVVESTVHLFLHNERTGAASIIGAASALTQQTDPTATNFAWPVGWDVFEAFKTAGRWYLFAHASGHLSGSVETTGRTRIFGFTRGIAGVALTEPLYEATWLNDSTPTPWGFTHAAGLAGSLVVSSADTGLVRVHKVDADVSAWAATLGTVAGSERAGFTPPWDVVEVAAHGKW